jgi:hypothetical protein
LMRKTMDHFRSRLGMALFLYTGYDTHPYHLYREYGFQGIEDQSGQMEHYRGSRQAFYDAWFVPGRSVIEPLTWRHWASAPPLFMGDFPGVIRCEPVSLQGRTSNETAMLPLLHHEAEKQQITAMALRHKDTDAVLGIAAWRMSNTEPGTCITDVYCHPDFWNRAGDLLASLPLPDAEKYLALADIDGPRKAEVLEKAGYRSTYVCPSAAFKDAAKTKPLDVMVFEKPRVAIAA